MDQEPNSDHYSGSLNQCHDLRLSDPEEDLIQLRSRPPTPLVRTENLRNTEYQISDLQSSVLDRDNQQLNILQAQR